MSRLLPPFPRSRRVSTPDAWSWMVIVIAFAVLCSGCSDPDSSPRESAEGASDQQTIVATVPPLGMILAELTKGRASVEVLLAPGASPHTYEPTPSDVRTISNSLMLIHAHDHLDGWVASLPAERTLELAPLVPSGQRLSMPSSGKNASESFGREPHTHDPRNTADQISGWRLRPPLLDLPGRGTVDVPAAGGLALRSGQRRVRDVSEKRQSSDHGP